MSDKVKKSRTDRKGKLTYQEPQEEGGKVNPDEDPARRSKSGKPPWETNPKRKDPS